jgi:hypothetical protein
MRNSEFGIRNGRRLRLPALAVAMLLAAAPLAAQGAGSTGLEVAQMPMGARAGALAGAYTSMWNDADALFYNPAAVAGLGQAASLSYQRHVLDISFGALAGAARLGPVALGAGIAFMDGGEVPEIVPDPDFGGQRGRPTGATVSARETVFRLAAGAPLLGDRLHLGGSLGFALSELAGVSRSAPFADLGVQGRVAPAATVGFALRNLGGSLSGDGAAEADLPLEARLGASYLLPLPQNLGVLVTADAIQRVREETTAFAGGLELGLMPREAAGIGAVLRVGYRQEDALAAANALNLGAGVSFGGIALDYQYQDIEFFGTAHRVGVRWRR